ncbi:Ig-like domain-containing protein [Demequina flava]|uniref:Ig-like domain-containing protein n=1 Tax=Demequina flava TaxID=1095025 RepID=UPI000A44C623|nr:Ig-like domain-containing protein [Demequina flava]
MSAVDSEVGRATAARWRTARRIGVGVLVAVVGVGAFLAPGFDEREVTPDSPAVWALQTSSGQRMARVNTSVAELDTVKAVASPSDIVQADDTLLVFTNNLGSVTTMSAAAPHDISAEAPQGTVGTPAGTDVVVNSGDYVAYLTDAGEIFAGAVSVGTATTPAQLDPFADVEVEEGEERPQFRADAVAVSPTGAVAAYSAERGAMLTSESVTGAGLRTSALPEGPEGDELQVAWVGPRWVLLDQESALVWMSDLDEPVASGAAEGAVLQRSSGTADSVVIADEFGLVTVALDGSVTERVHGSADSLALGVAARPMEDPSAGGMVAAWLPEGAGPGALWREGQSPSELDFAGQTLGDRVVPTLRSNGARLILNEGRSGWVWDTRTGLLISSSQRWEDDTVVQAADEDRDVAIEVTEPRPPVAVADSFGVRAGRHIALPVLLNDHDPNEDVLAVDPESVQGMDDSFGTVTVADDAQTIVVSVAPEATGTATFTYAITDGTTSDGLLSDPASVTVTVHDASENSPPVWCGVDDCQLEWPAPQVAPGGTVTVDALTGWVDPDGDPVYLASAASASSVGVVAGAPDGTVVFQHTDASSTDTGAVPIDVVVSDTHGATESKDLPVAVVSETEMRVTDATTTVTAGVTASVSLADHVTGARAPVSVTEASVGPDHDAQVAPSQGDAGFTFTADDPGSYLVELLVSDGMSEARGTARITVIDEGDEQLSTVPLTAFVRSKEDVTIDVLDAVTNPRRSVLLLSDLRTDVADGAQLSADIVGHAALRLSGDTSDGQPGTLGTVQYTVSDGTGRPAGTTTGEVTVVLLGTDVPTAPLVVDDAVTVRAGTQADIPALDNDVAPAGNVIALDAASVSLGEGGGLAFPAGSVVRYLAPDVPGTYDIDYASYVLGFPTQADTATIRVTVTAGDTNAAPLPEPMRGRVASGQEVRLPFDDAGIDPDGDAVSLAAIETQPVSGSARVSSDGRSLVYTSESGFAGQASFTFTVEDARGATAVGTATIGVLDSQLDPRPVTYTDYVQAQVGEDRRVVITPASNDQDLGGGELALVSVAPDAEPGSAEFAALEERLIDVDDGRVTLSVGTEPGTSAYVYTVENESGSTSIGRIILKSVREPIADVPIVSDTILTSETRETFASGVDVLTDKVAWGAGDASDLSVALWGDAGGNAVDGWQISGSLPDDSLLVPFQVSGLNFAQEEVVSYGFLRVPGDEEIRVALREGFQAPQVNEEESVTFDIRDLIALPPETPFTIDADAIAASGQRAEGVCVSAGATEVRYDAGEGEPYTDTCRVPVLVEGLDEAVLLPVPIVVVPNAPQPILTGAALEISPGQTSQFNLADMVTWPPGAPGRPVSVAMNYVGEQFTVERAGDTITVTAADSAQPGSADAVTVTLPDEQEIAPVTLTLTVGPAPSALPKGASVVKQCSQADGSSCTIEVIGGSGEVNPLPGTPLELESVNAAGTCTGVTFSKASETSIRASWTGSTSGTVCDATFVVVDAQGRQSSGDRAGQISLDLQGFPAGPASISQAAYGDGSVTLSVDPGAASSAYPAITGFTITSGGSEVTTCSAQGACGEITGLSNGQKAQYTAVARNDVGASKSSATTTAWSYAPPTRPALVSSTPSKAGTEGLRADLVFQVNDPSTRQLVLTSASGEERVHTVSGRGQQTVNNYLVGSNAPTTVTVTPVTAHELPPVGSGIAQGESLSVSANGVGGPRVSDVTWKASTDGARVTFSGSVASAGAGSQTWVGVALEGERCSTSVQSSGGSMAVTVEVDANRLYDYVVCAESQWEGETYGTSTTQVDGVYTFEEPSPPQVGGYGIDNTCEPAQRSFECETGWDAPSVSSSPSGFQTRYIYDGDRSNVLRDFTLNKSFGRTPDIAAVYCPTFLGADAPCNGPATPIPAADSSRAYPVAVEFTHCSALAGTTSVEISGGGANATVVEQWWQAGSGSQQAVEPWERRYASVRVSFSGPLSGITPWESGRLPCSEIPLPPNPTPTPTPTTSPTTPAPDPNAGAGS